MKVTKKILAIIMVLALSVTALAGCGGGDEDAAAPEDQTITWKMQCAYPPGDQTYDIQMPMIAEAITAATDGKIQFELYIPGAICEPAQAPTSVAKGILDAAISAPNDCAQFVTAAYAEQGIPFYWTSGQDVYDNFYDGGMLDYLREEYAKAGLYYGMYVPNGAYQLMTSFPVNTAADLKGKKIRSSTSYAELMNQMGAAPVTMPGGDIYMAMKLGTIEGAIYTVAELETSKLKEVTKYVMDPAACGSAPVNMIIGQKAWDALTPELQEQVNQAMQDVFMDVYQKSVDLDIPAREAAAAYGVQFIEVPEADMVPFYEAGERVVDVLVAKYPDSAKGFELIKAWKETKK